MNLDSAIFYSNDIEKAKSFYQDLLGLKLEGQQGDEYVSFIFPNGIRLGIKRQSEAREKPGFQTIFLATDDIEELYQKLKQKGVEIYTDLAEKPWGKEFSILDPDENKVLFIKR